MDLNKEIRETIAFYCGGTFENRKIATEKILQICKNKPLTIHSVVASLLCVDSKEYSYITPKAKYKVIEKLQGCYKIVNDYGIEGVYEKDCFKEL